MRAKEAEIDLLEEAGSYVKGRYPARLARLYPRPPKPATTTQQSCWRSFVVTVREGAVHDTPEKLAAAYRAQRDPDAA